MPRKAKIESQAEQSERFKREAERMIAAGELSPTEAEAAIENVLRSQARQGKPG
jgi:polyhydroxyalkanoate synthesis regulator phasin